MWQPKSFKTKNRILDLSSSGQSAISVHELYADDVRISNGIELNNWDDTSIQLFVCESCAFVQCQPGNWGTLRKAGDYVLLLPLFHEMLQSDGDFEELSPPAFLKKHGAMLLALKQYTDLQQIIPSIPTIENIQELNSAEVARLMQWEAPQEMLGVFPNPVKLEENKLLATDQDSDSAAINQLSNLLNDAIYSNLSVNLAPIAVENTIASFFIDGIQYTEWRPMGLFGDSWQLFLEPGYRITRSTDGNS